MLHGCSSQIPEARPMLTLVLVALRERARQHVDARAPMPWVIAGIALVAILAIVHVLRGVGLLGGPC